jgi:uncharacterized protein (DUF362 family)
MNVSLWQTSGQYPVQAPFHPNSPFSEHLFPETSAQPNYVYEAVRELFNLQGFDSVNFGSAKWNPLGTIIRKGDRVMLKPNLISERHPRGPEGWQYILTHGSVIRAVADYAFKATGDTGEVIIADAPQTDSSFTEICRVLGLDEVERFYSSKGLRFRLIDLRRFQWKTVDDVVVSRETLPGDSQGYATINLGGNSLFRSHACQGRYYGADYNTDEVNAHHHDDTHEYVVSRSALECDVFINLPKLKTHKKTGVTLSIKNLVGINGDKNYLPHFTQGTPADGGDEYPDGTLGRSVEALGRRTMRKLAISVPTAGPWLFRQARKAGTAVFGATDNTIRSGNWWGNDTCWRMCLDLNRILLYADPNGYLRPDDVDSRKRYLTIIDGIIGGEGNGPIDVDPIASGVLLLSTDPVAADAVAARLMGFDPSKIPIIARAAQLADYRLGAASLDDIEVLSNHDDWCGKLNAIDFSGQKCFRPYFGWRGKIEMDITG